jgi:hypothetical protein
VTSEENRETKEIGPKRGMEVASNGDEGAN